MNERFFQSEREVALERDTQTVSFSTNVGKGGGGDDYYEQIMGLMAKLMPKHARE